MVFPKLRVPGRWIVLPAVGAVALTAAGVILASDHQDTAEVELHPRLDINDVYVFPGSTTDRLALAVTTSSPITPAASAGSSFDPGILYQIKIDNTGDAVEDLVFQFTFTGTGSGQQVSLRGPAAPGSAGGQSVLLDVAPTLTGAVNTVLGSPTGVQLFAGLREDPFFIDLEQFFKIIPDRAPVQGPLSKIGPKPEASSFRDPGIDFLAGINTLAIVIELPESMILPAGADASTAIGVWATTSR
jgi:hypothetical protein